MKKILFIIAFLSIISGAKAQNSVSVYVTDIDKSTGKVYIALFDSKVPFLRGKAIEGKIVEVTGQTMNIDFENIEGGEYAITMFYDENDNGKLDLGKYSIPTEKYGFSNNIDPAVLQRPPVFDECKFNVNGNTKISVQLISAVK
jgi:uncharacterized protein (DUF2141 family)